MKTSPSPIWSETPPTSQRIVFAVERIANVLRAGAWEFATAEGLNPGFITNVPPQYQTQDMQQSKFYWGQHPFQVGPEFNRELYTQAPAAPATPWGLQEMYTPMNIQQYVQNAMLQNQAGIAPAPAPRTPPITVFTPDSALFAALACS